MVEERDRARLDERRQRGHRLAAGRTGDRLVEEGGDDDGLLAQGLDQQQSQLGWVVNVGMAAKELHARRGPEEWLAYQVVIGADAADDAGIHAAVRKHSAEPLA